ncbi:MAG TPA: SMP-30/gluconolactonase/LRE family protein [Blastocatellia bacterium]|nr:SMP-30/gluconolactonase/LRE family protein [Blastocatellia bacterium]
MRCLLALSFRIIAAALLLSPVAALAQIIGIGPVGQVSQAQTGFQFTEGPAVDTQGNIYFTDVQRSRIHKIDRQGQLTTFLENTQGMNGLMFDPRGRLIACQSTSGRIVAIDVATKAVTDIATQFEGARFNSPNDLVIDRQGNIYFSDRNGNTVYFIATDNTVRRLITTLTLPNGLLLSLDEKTLYVLYGSPNLVSYPINSPGQLGAPQMTALQGAGGGDGMTIDTQGNLYITRPNINAVQVLTPAGQSLGTIAFQEAPSNCVFGGADLKTLFVTARTSIYTARMQSIGYRFASPVASVSAASFSGSQLAAETITALFGNGLATATQTAGSVPLPTQLAGTSVKVTDSAGTDRLSPLFFVAPSQVNYLIPPGTAAGGATATLTAGDGSIFTEGLRIAAIAPGVFSANASGQDVASAVALRVRADNSQSYEAVARFDSAANRFVAVPIDLGAASDQVFLLLYGTGIRGRSALSAVTATIGGINAPVEYAGAQGDFAGLDQLNVRLPRTLAGRGDVDVIVSVDGKPANTVKLNIK